MTRPLLENTGFELGLFASNCSGGFTPTKAPGRWTGSWEDNLKLAQVADEVGLDFILPIARFIGYGGETNFHGGVLDPVAWGSGLLALTQRISVVATIHTAFNNPVIAAKQLVTMDHIGEGRAGINIVAGWNKPEYEALGGTLLDAHDDRYAQAQEWWDVVRTVWNADGQFDFDGDYYQLKNCEGMPKPVDGDLPVLNAGSSPQGRSFASRNANFAFTNVVGPEDGAEVVAKIEAEARETYDREVRVLTNSHVVCRPTEKEAVEFRDWYGDELADWDAVDNLMGLMGANAQSFSKEMLATFRARFAAGHGSQPLIGTPEQIAERLREFSEAGFQGMTLAFFNYHEELPYFAENVLPLLDEMGIRPNDRSQL
ncbi:MAG: LLM class flavin-dependent oxidoreductase [Actinobacteria bacterium]|nr:LLM class flavin-dependent oxidoreductase [Actinomycetota bacterium]